MSKGPHGVSHEAHRPVVMGRRGMVVSGHPLASQAGVDILRRGGNAVDAALAVAAALGVVEPHMSGVGGDGFLMVYWRESGNVEVANATGAAPQRATREVFRGGIPMKGILSVSVPGLVDGWLAVQAKYGAVRPAELFAEAIELAEGGFPVSHKLAEYMEAEPALLEYPSSRKVFAPAGRPLRAGEMLRQPDLARTLATIAAEGADALYRGPIARALLRCSEELGGLLVAEDLARHRTRWQAPVHTDYRGYTVFEAPPNSCGYALLQMLNMLEEIDVRSLGCNTVAAVHAMVEVKKLAFADRERYLADPEWVDIPLAELLSKEYARQRARLVDPERAARTVTAGVPRRGAAGGSASQREEDTTCFVVVDGAGNAVCQLQSIQSPFGSALVADGTGILLNNRMTYWHLADDHVDRLEPGKRVRHTMNPVMVFEADRLRLICGTPGADTQLQTNLQVLTHVLDFGLTVQEAVEAPRWRHQQNETESTVPHTCEDQLQLEERFPREVGEELEGLGHPVVWVGDWAATGSEVMIEIDPTTGALQGGADPRRDAYAVGL